jgi:protein TonB
MNDEPLFSGLLITRAPCARRPRRRTSAIALAAGLHLAILGSVVLAPFIVLEVMVPPKAMSSDILFRPPSRQGAGGDTLPASAIQKGTHGRPRGPARPADRRPPQSPARPESQPDAMPVTPPEPNPHPAIDSAADDAPQPSDPHADQGETPGDPGGRGDSPDGTLTGCSGCVGGDTGHGTRSRFGYDVVLDAGTPGPTPPVLIPATRSLPLYPDLARRARVQGTVVMMIVIQADGSVGEVEVVRAPDPVWGFDTAALQAVRHWRYTPALMHGLPVAVYAQVMVEFTLSR